MIFQEQPNEPWTRYDFLFLEAFQILQDETCSKCGNPVWLCRSDSRDIEFKIESMTCQAEKRLKAAEAKRTGAKPDAKEKREWGKSYFSVPQLNPASEHTELPSRRDFYASLVK